MAPRWCRSWDDADLKMMQILRNKHKSARLTSKQADLDNQSIQALIPESKVFGHKFVFREKFIFRGKLIVHLSKEMDHVRCNKINFYWRQSNTEKERSLSPFLHSRTPQGLFTLIKSALKFLSIKELSFKNTWNWHVDIMRGTVGFQFLGAVPFIHLLIHLLMVLFLQFLYSSWKM